MAQPMDSDTTGEVSLNAGVSRRGLLKGAIAGAGAIVLGSVGQASAQTSDAGKAAPVKGQDPVKGARTQVAPFAIASAPGVLIRPILTAGDAALNGYRMVGIPDGLGAMPNGGAFTLLMNHEIPAANGIVRRHGSKGAFVSQWKIDRDTFNVIEGKDFAQAPTNVHLWDPGTRTYTTGTTAWNRFCSGDMPLPSALRYLALGTGDRIYFNGEETTDGRGWAHIATGPEAGHTWQLPRLGRMPFENLVASPHGKAKTIMVLGDDGALATAPVAANGPCQCFVYVGTKQANGNTIERAGLTNGKLYGLKIFREQTLVTEESNDFGLGDATTGYVDFGSFMMVEIGPAGDVSSQTGLQVEQDAIAKDIFRFQRCEDGAWDPRETNPTDFYFVTTASQTLNSRLWRLRFNDVNIPENGGQIEILLNATPGRMFDNICIDKRGRLLIQEDTGNNPHVAKIWAYGIDTGELIQVASHDPASFEPGGASFITQDEESSGIIDASEILGEGWFLFDVQVHKPNTTDPELFESGQLLAMYVPMELGRTGVVRTDRKRN